MNNTAYVSLNRQSGAAVLLVSILLLLGVTLIVIFAARVGVMDQRISGNEYRHKEAKAAADAALDQAAAFINQNQELYEGEVGGAYSWRQCKGSSIGGDFPCSVGTTSYDLVLDAVIGTTTIDPLQPTLAVNLASGIEANSYIVYTTSASVGNIITAIGKGASLDGTGDAYAQISYAQVKLLTPGQIPPIMTPVVDLSGNFTIVADPNGGGSGVPISAWASTFDTSGGLGSWQTCQLGDFRDGSNNVCSETRDDSISWSDCACVADQHLSDSGSTGINYDIVDADSGDFPSSPFHYVFPTYNDFSDVMDAAYGLQSATGNGAVLTSCANIVSVAASFTESGLIAVDGDCNIPSNAIIGSRDAPVVLVVSGDLQTVGNADLYGIVLGLNEVHLGGGVTVHGSMVAEDPTKLTTGGYTQVYDEFIKESLAEDLETIGLAKRAYSWVDFQP